MKRLCLVAALLLAAGPAYTAVVPAIPVSETGVALSTAQTGDGNSTNVMDRGYTLGGPCLLTLVTTVGATPTVTVAIQGSADGSTFFNIAYSLIATPETVAVANVTITSATTNHYILRPNHPWRYLRLVYSANTNVTTTATAYPTWN
jgi:hypothetical protein